MAKHRRPSQPPRRTHHGACPGRKGETASPFPWNHHRDRLPPGQRGRSRMRRREFIAGLGSAAAWPVVVRAQQRERVRVIGVLIVLDENDLEGKTFVSAFIQALADLGWLDGRNVRMDLRWGGGDANRMRALAKELVGLQPDIIVTIGACQTPSPAASSPGSTARVGTSPASLGTKPRWEASGLSCSQRSRPGSGGPHSSSIPTPPPQPHRLICPHLRRRPGHSRSSQSPAAVPDRHGGLRRRTSSQSQATGAWP
jgi:hypothetical protein